jgi:ubiquinone/menaquinone biosynthesis C-methylase UbiE
MSGRTSSQESERILRVFQSKEETKAFYNKIAKVYDLLSERSEQPMRAAGLEKLAVRPGESVLELAKSVGPTGKVFGVDIAEKMVATAQHTLAKEDLALGKEDLADRVQLDCDDAAHLPYRDETIDAVIMNFTLELFDTPEIPRVLAECRRVLRPGGRIVVVGLSKEGKQGLVIRAFEWTHRHFPNLMDCRPIFVGRALQSAGFHVEESMVEHMWVPVEIVLATKP